MCVWLYEEREISKKMLGNGTASSYTHEPTRALSALNLLLISHPGKHVCLSPPHFLFCPNGINWPYHTRHLHPLH